MHKPRLNHGNACAIWKPPAVSDDQTTLTSVLCPVPGAYGSLSHTRKQNAIPQHRPMPEPYGCLQLFNARLNRSLKLHPVPEPCGCLGNMRCLRDIRCLKCARCLNRTDACAMYLMPEPTRCQSRAGCLNHTDTYSIYPSP